MSAQILAAVILLPFVFVALYAGIHEFLRFRSEGRANYGLIFDEETGTSYVTGIAEEEDAFDPDDFDPNDYNDPEVAGEPDERKT
ncbi:hypothetical protein BMI91_15330 [Thioclava sediminum]|uniref:Uncharacterized protein n=1 Tax=Thioclava sediminum TaxID=1915319 RepID=A0ABX3MW15_9RHOB|nr:hypothetical protein [Thioclava sediminum]OOY23887.1 hypothetical protein BMI91_15330 [Thioclava sediminum]